jgi:hypothetical protein
MNDWISLLLGSDYMSLLMTSESDEITIDWWHFERIPYKKVKVLENIEKIFWKLTVVNI